MSNARRPHSLITPKYVMTTYELYYFTRIHIMQRNNTDSDVMNNTSHNLRYWSNLNLMDHFAWYRQQKESVNDTTHVPPIFMCVLLRGIPHIYELDLIDSRPATYDTRCECLHSQFVHLLHE